MKVLKGRVTLVALVAVVVVVAAGGGYAVASGGGTIRACVHKGTKVLYVGKCAKHDSKLHWSVTGPQGPAGATGAPGAAGAAGAPGAPGTAKAYGSISQSGGLVAAFSKGVTSVTNPEAGVICVAVSGASSSTEGAVATPDYSNDDTGSSNIAHVEWVSDPTLCPTGDFEFLTSDVTASTTLANTITDEAFFFIVP
jgi:hypothetical protein